MKQLLNKLICFLKGHYWTCWDGIKGKHCWSILICDRCGKTELSKSDYFYDIK